MKRLLSLIAFAILITPAFGQLQVKSESKGRTVVKSYNMGNVTLDKNKNNGDYILCAISDNQYAGYFEVYLGKTNEECLQTLYDLLKLYDMDKDATTTIHAYGGEAITIGITTAIATKYLLITQEYMAGKHLLYRPYLNKMVKYFGGTPVED